MNNESVGWEAELEVAREAAAAAATILLARAGAEDVREKGRADLVTAVDEASERAIEQRLRAAFPDDGCLKPQAAAW